ncbi:MAG: carbohydrate binding family 9 domain-containing protein [Cyclobacteriaceae bacterium]|nr:carbohydrate binding family 9 domain-containing protein [Cyclobacteriaceae bacterium]
MLRLLFLFGFLCISGATWAQLPGLKIRKAQHPIVLDGKMEEADWLEADIATHFKQVFPFDSSFSKAQTEVRMTYDDHNIYVFAVMYNREPRKYVTASLRRDYRGPGNDGFSMTIDTYKDKTNGFLFGVNPFGVQREGLVANGGNGQEDLNLSWDNKWYAEARMLEDRWVAEIAIPFKTLRFKHGLDSWHINFYRIDSHEVEMSSWSPIPRIYSPTVLAFNRDLLWDQPLNHPGGNVSVIPYVANRNITDFENHQPSVNTPTLGADAKIALGPAMNLDLTVNPDFSQVEVDQQVTNLSRFEIFYPEKRQFFLENADLFANFGSNNMRPFFSRRIGVSRSPTTGQNIQDPIIGGVRLSGKLDNKTRVGFLNMQSAKVDSINEPSTNYMVGVVQRKVFSRSNVGLIMVNKQAFHDSLSKDFNLSPNKFNRMIGIDYNLGSKNNRWNGKFFYHRSFNQNKNDSAYASSAILSYVSPKLEVDIMAQTVGAHYDPEVGYLPRQRFNRLAPEAYYLWYPKSKIINSHGPGTDIDLIGNDLYGFTDWDANLWYKINFQNQATFFMRIRRDYVYLFSNFDPSGSGGLELPKGSSYYYNGVIINYTSNPRKRLVYNFQSRSGQYFNGSRLNLDGTISYRFQPYAIVSVDYSLNHISLPKPYNSANLVLISPKFDLTFSRKLFWTTYVQYNNQISNVNINSRLQWRFKPVSDLFIVYTDNYFAETMRDGRFLYIGQPKFRALVVKLTYWINM